MMIVFTWEKSGGFWAGNVKDNNNTLEQIYWFDQIADN